MIHWLFPTGHSGVPVSTYDDDFDEDYKTYDYKLSVVSFRASDGNDLRYETQMNTFLQEKLPNLMNAPTTSGLIIGPSIPVPHCVRLEKPMDHRISYTVSRRG